MITKGQITVLNNYLTKFPKGRYSFEEICALCLINSNLIEVNKEINYFDNIKLVELMKSISNNLDRLLMFLERE